MQAMYRHENAGSDPFGPLGVDHWLAELQDGSCVLVRPIRPDDTQMEHDFIARLSSQSRRYRFLGEVKELSDAMATRFTHVDFHSSMAFVALVHDKGELREVGVSRYSATGDDASCECAVTVADEWSHLGLGTVLMRRLIDVARSNGFRRMVSLDKADNTAMRSLATDLGFTRTRYIDDPTLVLYELAL